MDYTSLSNQAGKADGASDRILIIGGGAAGVAVGKAFTQKAIPFDIVERERDFGGNWFRGSEAARVYRSTHLISSRTNTQFGDYPMPDDYPPYPNHAQFLDYLRQAAREFNLYERTQFNLAVERLYPLDHGWLVEFADKRRIFYSDIVVANGLLREPVIPAIPGEFYGQILHSSAYDDADILDGKRVLVVGAGNSGCDIAVDSATRASRTFQSTRRGYHYMPKFIHGRPTQEWLMEIVSEFDSSEAYWSHVRATFKMAGFDGTDYGLPQPDHSIHEAHPILNSQVLYHIGHGDILPKQDVTRFDGHRVVFADGSSEEIDVVILATGYKPSMPFLDPELIDWRDGLHKLFLNSIPVNFDNIVFAGFFNIPSGFGNIANTCSRFLASYFHAKHKKTNSFRTFNEFKKMKDEVDLGREQFVKNARHKHELDLWKYIKTVNFLNERLEMTH